jgi:AraC family transcriptional regulator
LEPGIEMLEEKKFIGLQIKMSFSDNKTLQLWRSFMPRRKEIKNSIGTELYSIEIYEPFYFNYFDPEKVFEKWAAIEVTDFDAVPHAMETIITPRGLYAVFQYKGEASKGAEIYHYIFRTWLPESDYLLDSRPHFAIMGDKYKNEDPDSEEELCIPIKMK